MKQLTGTRVSGGVPSPEVDLDAGGRFIPGDFTFSVHSASGRSGEHRGTIAFVFAAPRAASLNPGPRASAKRLCRTRKRLSFSMERGQTDGSAL